MKKIASLFLTVLIFCIIFAVPVMAGETGVTDISYITVSCDNASSETFKEITFAGKQWIVLKEDQENQTALILMKDNYAAGSYGQTSTKNAAVTYKDSKLDKAMNAFYNSLSDEDKSLIALSSIKESIVINDRSCTGLPAEYFEAGDTGLDAAINTYGLQGVLITGTENTYTMERYVFAPSAKDIMNFGLKKVASSENGGLLEYTAVGETPFEDTALEEIFAEDIENKLDDYSFMLFLTRSADTTRTGFIYAPDNEGNWNITHGKSPKAGIRPALNLDLTKVQFVQGTINEAESSDDDESTENGLSYNPTDNPDKETGGKFPSAASMIHEVSGATLVILLIGALIIGAGAGFLISRYVFKKKKKKDE